MTSPRSGRGACRLACAQINGVSAGRLFQVLDSLGGECSGMFQQTLADSRHELKNLFISMP
jgi:hypothetical protein